MNAIFKAITACRIYVDLPDDVTDEELKPLVIRLLEDAGQTQVSMNTIGGEISGQIAAKFPRAVITEQDRAKLATKIIELARASQI